MSGENSARPPVTAVASGLTPYGYQSYTPDPAAGISADIFKPTVNFNNMPTGAQTAWDDAAGAIQGLGFLGMGVSVLGGAVGFFAGRSQMRKAERQQRRAQAKLNSLLSNRQEIINPYEGVQDLSGLAKDLSGQMNNPYANLGVATQAAEIQMEQTDMALANTLDTLAASGASAGGATALAQAALQSKKGVAANIEQQEAQNEKLRAQGEQQLQQMKISEQQRLQQIAISEGQRVQSAEAAGKQFEFQAREARQTADIQRVENQMLQAQQTAAAAQGSMFSSIGSAIGGIGGAIGGMSQGMAALGSRPA